MAAFIRKVGRLLLAWAAYFVLIAVAFLLILAIVLAWPIVWRFLVALAIALFVYRVIYFGQALGVLRAVVATVAGFVAFYLMARNQNLFESVGRWLMFIALAATPFYFLARRLPSFFSPPAANRPDAANEERSPREFTSDDAARLVDSLDAKWGSTRPTPDPPSHLAAHPSRAGMRAVHSHGTWARATFVPYRSDLVDNHTAWLSELELPLLGADELSGVVRFSNFSGAPHRDDTRRQPHGLAVKLNGPEEPEPVAGLDMVAIDMRRFMVRTREDFHTFSAHLAKGPVRRYLGWLGMAVVGRSTLQSVLGMAVESTTSYADRTYHGLNTFWCRIQEPAGRSLEVPVRFRFVPTHAPANRTRTTSTTRLHDELVDRLDRNETISFRVELIDGRGVRESRLFDPVRAWPADQAAMPIGLLTLTENAPDDPEIVFNPHRLCQGIRPSDDEILMARRAAYPESHVRRTS